MTSWSGPLMKPTRRTASTTTSIAVTTTTYSSLGVALVLLVIRFWKSSHQHADRSQEEKEETTMTGITVESVWRSLRRWIRRRRLRMTTKRPPSPRTAVVQPSPPLATLRSGNLRGHHHVHNPNTDDGDTAVVDPRHVVIVRQQQGRIQDILRYWFGRFTPAEAQKKLWMISSQQATAHRRRVDADILRRFGHLYLGSDDDDVATAAWEEWLDADLYGVHGKVAAIILLDQFSRHVHRCLQESSYSDNTNSTAVEDDSAANNIVSRLTNMLPCQADLDQSALAVAQSVLEHHEQDLPLLSQAMQIFTYMPFRHANRLDTVQFVQGQIQVWTDLQQQHEAMLSRFRKATHRRLAVLQDEARRTGNGETTRHASASSAHEDILEAPPFHVEDMTPATEHIVYTTIQQFLLARGITTTTRQSSNDNNTKYPIIVSLSGGVDSMVICAVLAHLANTGTLPIHVVAVHIDYANRPESAAEAAFCRDWCRRHDVDFYVRRIDEVTRGITARDAYEKISRQMRYTFYRTTTEKYASSSSPAEAGEIGVVLGHHRGDLRENVLSNAHKGSGPLDLSGMTAVSRNDGVTLYRPLLPLEKTFVFDYAHSFGVPYFKDTTPHWSTRGKLRNRLLPLLEEIYGEGCLSNLSNLAVESDECRALLEKVCFGPFMERIRRRPMGMILSTAPWKDQGLFFWKFVLREALHSGGMGMFTDKAVDSFLERVRAGKQGWLQCRKEYAVFLQADGDVFVWKPESFPWHKKDQYKVDGQAVGFGRDHSVEVGPWRVTALLVPVDHRNYDVNDMEEEVQARLQCRAVDSMEHLMDGSIKYYVQVPTFRQDDGSLAPRPLVFRKFTKPSRPLAWKNFDTKVQDTLPLLGNDDSALAALRDPIGTGAAHENEAGETVPNPTHPVKVTVCLADIYPPASPVKMLKKGVDVVRI